MSWKDYFRKLKIERKRKEGERKTGEEKEKRFRKELKKMVHKYERRVGRVIKEFSRASGYKVKRKNEGGVWLDAGYFLPDYSGRYCGPHFCVAIRPDAVHVRYYDYNEQVPLEIFTEEALAAALVRVYEKASSS